jgi:hypothetical protein
VAGVHHYCSWHRDQKRVAVKTQARKMAATGSIKLPNEIFRKHASPKIILVGQIRTSSTSMWIALQKLGYKCSDSTLRSYLLLEPKQLPHQHAQWTRALRGKFFGTNEPLSKNEWSELVGPFEVRGSGSELVAVN